MKIKTLLLMLLTIGLFTACSSVVVMNSSRMEQLELGMSKKQVTDILGNEYTISEKRMEDGNEVEVLSYRDFYKDDEFYLFRFKNNRLEEWHREVHPRYELKK